MGGTRVRLLGWLQHSPGLQVLGCGDSGYHRDKSLWTKASNLRDPALSELHVAAQALTRLDLAGTKAIRSFGALAHLQGLRWLSLANCR